MLNVDVKCVYLFMLFFKVKMEQDREKEVDRTPESLIYVEGVEAQALFNFLMNCKSSTASTGPLAGVPPTLLAPVAFHGATLKPLKVFLKTEMFNLTFIWNKTYVGVDRDGKSAPTSFCPFVH
jgi:hypothetical protein